MKPWCQGIVCLVLVCGWMAPSVGCGPKEVEIPKDEVVSEEQDAEQEWKQDLEDQAKDAAATK